MSIRDVVALIDKDSDKVAPFAASLALAFDAHLTYAAIDFDPISELGIIERSTARMLTALEESREAAAQTLERAAQAGRNAGLAIETEMIGVGASRASAVLGSFLRHFDLTLIEQADPGRRNGRTAEIEAALFGSGRPVLVVPYVHRQPFSVKMALVAWDGTLSASRAIAAAKPFLVRASRVEIVHIDRGDPHARSISPFAITRHLARNKVNASFRSVTTTGDIAGALLSYAFDAEADLLVMGGYGHSRFREYALGGATRGVLESMTLPTLMAH